MTKVVNSLRKPLPEGGLSPEKLALFQELLSDESLDLAVDPAIPPRSSSVGAPPLSFAQKRLWFLERYYPGTATYNINVAYHMRGALDQGALARSLHAEERRHESLRTTFALEGGEPVQRIAAAGGRPPLVVDLSGLLPAAGMAEAERLRAAIELSAFDLEHGPLWRIFLMRFGPAEHVLVLAMHHIVSDGWSMGVLVREICDLYAAAVEGREPPLPPLPIQYADFSLWQRQSLTGEALARQLDYWRERLAQLPPPFDLPSDRPRPAARSWHGDLVPCRISRELHGGLGRLTRSAGATPFMSLLAVFVSLLHRYTGAEDLTIGSPVANRHRRETEGLIGLFVNTLLLRLRPAGQRSFGELLGQVREVTLGAYDHQDLPFEKLVEELEPARDPSRTPLFQVMFVLQNVPQTTAEMPGLTLTPLKPYGGTAKLDLTLSLLETDQGLSGEVEYWTGLFERSTVARLVEHFRNLLAGIVGDPGLPLAALPLLSPAERHQLLVEWGVPETLADGSRTLHELFEAAVERRPDAEAVTWLDRRLSYRDLDRRANRLANCLRSLGVGPEARVGLCTERSLDLVVGVLGILKAGGAYVPLDPAYPEERLAFLVQDSGMSVVVTEEAFVERLASCGAYLLCLDADASRIEQWGEEQPVSEALPGNAAYVIYTSGSTGTPKGVVVTHHNVTRLFAATRRWIDPEANDVWALFHSFAFDFSVWELWGALLHGGRLVIVPYATSRSPEAFHELLCEERVSVLNQTPSAFRQLVRAEQSQLGTAAAGKLALRLVIFGGEALDLRSLRPWLERHGDVRPRLVNMYGITETTVHVTYREVGWADLASASASVIGVPIPDLSVYVLDGAAQPVPPGLPGELYVGGAGLARGYLGRPALSAERFVPNPFGRTAGERLYKTGDLGRYRAGRYDLEYLGRVDHQVKVRGFRIELGEIEAVLGACPGVRETVVLVREDTPGEPRLVAYVVPSAAEPPTAGQLRGALLDKLPDYMVPALFQVLDALPLTEHGKVDRRTLPAPGPQRPELEQQLVPPRTLHEEILTQVWMQVLGLERVGINDNFFSLGGDSILILRVQTLAAQRGLHFSVQQLFAHQQIESLAELAARGAPGAVAPAVTAPLSLLAPEDLDRLPADIEDAYPLTALQAGMLYHMRFRPEEIVYHNVYTYPLRVRFDARALTAAVERLVPRHPILRTSFDLTSYSEPLQLVHRHAVLPVEVADLRHLSAAAQEEAMAAFVEAEKRHSFDISRPPLLRFCVHRRDNDVLEFTLTEFHPIFDGWSLHSLISEILDGYFVLLAGGISPEAPPLHLEVRDFVALERAATESPQCREFWAQKLRHAAVLTLPGQVGGGIDSGTGARIRHVEQRVPDALFARLRELARSQAMPFKTLLLAAHLKVLSLASGQRDVVTGLVANGRPEGDDSDRLLGLFLNVVPFRVVLTEGSWLELLWATFEAEREMLPFRRYPLAQLQSSQGGKPLFTVLFNYIHFHVLRHHFESGGVEVLGGFRRWEETQLPFSVSFLQDPLSQVLVLRLRYDVGEFLPAQVERIRLLFAQTLSAMVEEPGGPHDRPDLIGAAERHQILVEWNDTGSAVPRGVRVHELITAQAERTPEALAVVSGEQRMTYAELDARADRLARLLGTMGVTTESLVGVYLPRSLEAIVAMLAVLKAGGAYVALDPLHPVDRITALLGSAGISLLLSGERLAAGLPLWGGRTLVLDRPAVWEAGGDVPSRSAGTEDAGGSPMAASAAYVIFTSGSSGLPKGVVVEHRQLVSYLHGISLRLGLPAGASYAVVSTLAADLGYTAIYPCLTTGGCLHLLSDTRGADAAALTEYFSRHPIDVLKIVPTHLAALLAASPDPARILPQARLVLGGETLEWPLVERLAGLAPRCAIFNHYGPTETTVGMAAICVEPGGVRAGSTAPLGRALANSEAYILDSHLRPVSIGVPGELCVGGAGLARGYLGWPEATAERFIPHPWATVPGARLYRTGDQARWLPDGRLEFLGRLDGQVKIRGFRIELRELEIVLARHPGVLEAAAAVCLDQAGDKQLVAYIAAPGSVASDAELRSFLRRQLPDYMLPAAFIRLPSLPRNSNGKLDRRALPAPAVLTTGWEMRHLPPRNQLERTLAGVWQEVMQTPEVGVDDNFFELGGHSLVMLRIHGKLRQVLGRDIPMVTLFDHPTIALLARHLSGETESQEGVGGEETERAMARHSAIDRRAARGRAARQALPSRESGSDS